MMTKWLVPTQYGSSRYCKRRPEHFELQCSSFRLRAALSTFLKGLRRFRIDGACLFECLLSVGHLSGPAISTAKP